jgi:synaptobrevin family protein YKT6
MVKAIYIGIYSKLGEGKDAIKLDYAYNSNLFGWYIKDKALEYINFSTRTSVSKSEFTSRTSLPIDIAGSAYILYTYVSNDGLACTLLTDGNYPKDVAYKIISSQIIAYRSSSENWKEFTVDQNSQSDSLKLILSQKPEEIDKLYSISVQLGEIKEIMHKNIQEVIGRGVKIEVLMQKSQDLSDSSRIFANKARQTRCCPWF